MFSGNIDVRKNFRDILIILFLTLSGCKPGETTSCTGSIETELLDSFFEKPTQTVFAAKIKSEKLQQVGYINQYNANYVIKYNWGQYGSCYGFYTFNGSSGILEQAKYYWGDSATVFENALKHISNDEIDKNVNQERHACFFSIYKQINTLLAGRKDICITKELPEDPSFSRNPPESDFKGTEYYYRNYFSGVKLIYYNEQGAVLIWDLNYRNQINYNRLCR
ncbi:MAG TPA: hypothetical protein VK154_20155 [Chitinophagales bacterium]|nr:hypothetical protein [Chitinophagales bacterium]